MAVFEPLEYILRIMRENISEGFPVSTENIGELVLLNSCLRLSIPAKGVGLSCKRF
jgi:hypothetical protein